MDDIKAIDYVALQASWDETDPRATGNYIKGGFVTGISEELIDTMLRGLEPHPGRGFHVYFQQSGGAIGRVPTDATAFAHRYAKHDMFATVSWPAGDSRDEHVRFIKDYWATLEPFTKGFYVNDYYEETQEMIFPRFHGHIVKHSFSIHTASGSDYQ